MNQTINQMGKNNAGRDMNNPEPSPGTFPMPETLKDSLCLEAEKLIGRIGLISNLGMILQKEIDGYQGKQVSADSLQETMDFINRKIKAL